MKEDYVTINPIPHAWSTRMTIPELAVQASGKGLTEGMSAASAYAEMAERLSAGLQNLEVPPYKQFYGTAAKVKNMFDTFDYLHGHIQEHQDAIPNAIRVEDLLGHVGHLKQSDFDFIKNYSEFTSHWVDGYSLLNDRQVKVPLMLVRWISATNGLASGNTIEEAILHGSYECIERYTKIKAVKDKLLLPTIKYESIKVPYLKEILDSLYSNGVEFIIKNMSMDLDVFVTGVMFINHNVPSNCLERYSIKVGCAQDTEEALARCLIERCQGTHPKEEARFPTQIDPDTNDYLSIFFNGLSSKSLEFMKSGHIVDSHYGSYNDTWSELAAIKKTCETLSTDLIVVDQTHPVLQFPTVRVIMPGVSDSMRYWGEERLTKEMISDTSKEDKKRDELTIKMMRSFM